MGLSQHKSMERVIGDGDRDSGSDFHDVLQQRNVSLLHQPPHVDLLFKLKDI